MGLRVEWNDLVAVEATVDDVRAHASTFAAAYNDPRNAPLLGHDELLDEDDVIEHYSQLADSGHPFLLFRDGHLVGDGDLRASHGDGCEFAFLIADPSEQGKGLGTRFALMICTAGFARLGLTQIYASVIPANVASRRVFEKLGFDLDTSPQARAFADEEDDLVLSIERATFERANAAAIAQIALL